MKSDGAVIKSSSLKKAYEAEDSLAVEVIDRAVYYLGLAMGTLLNQFHPDLVILGGGIMEALGQDLIEGIKTEAKRHVMPGQMDGVVFELSHLSDDAGIYGAYELIRDHLTNRCHCKDS